MLKKNIALAALVCTIAFPAAASTTFQFDNLKWKNKTNSGFMPTDGIKCTDGDVCSSDVNHNVRNGDLTFVADGLTLKATSFYNGKNAAVVQDHDNSFSLKKRIGGGLGVYHVSVGPCDDDIYEDASISHGEKLVLTFDRPVELTSFSLRSEDHDTQDWIKKGTFLFNGMEMMLPKGTGVINTLNVVSSSFTFQFGGRRPDQFFVSSLTVSPVPEPSTYALMAAGLGAVGVAARKRKKSVA